MSDNNVATRPRRGQTENQYDPYPTRAALCAMARAEGVHTKVLAALEAETHETDPGHDYWMGRLETEMRRSV